MAFPVVAARATGRSTATNAVSHAMTLPAGIVAGDLLVVVVACDQNPTISVNTGVSGSGWSQLVQGANGTNVCSNVFWKIATGADALTITLSAADQTSHVSFRITGGYSVTGTSANGSSTNSDPGTHTPPDGAQDYLWIVTRAGDSTVVATAAPTNFSNLQTQAAAGTGGASINTAERAMNGSAYNPTNFTSASEQWVCFTLAVSPVAPAATGAAAGTLGLTGSATGEVTGGGGGGPSPAVGEASGILPLSGSGAGQALVGGAGAGSLPLTGTGDGDVRAAGQAAGALPLTGSGTGAAPAEGDGAGSLPLSGAATGAAPAKGDAAGVLPLAGAGAGVAPAVGQASGSLPLAGAGAAAVGETTRGEASGSLPLIGEAAGLAPVRGQGAGDLPLSGAATGTAEDPAAHATGRLAFAGPRLGQLLNAAPRRGAVLNAAPRLGTLAGPHARVGLILNPARRGDLLELTE